MKSAYIFDIKRFGINDGTGIRTVFFLKGCPLSCLWCQNPEGLIPDIRLWYVRHRCVGCQSCIQACPFGALSFIEQGVGIAEKACTRCGRCVEICPTGALRFDAVEMTVEEALSEVEKDRVFYDASGGGVTLSGGECTASPDFSLELLAACKARGINTSIETCLYTRPKTLEAFLLVTDKVIADVKLASSAAHRAATGKDNALILENLLMLARSDCDMLIRVPLIPGFTATEENIRGIGAILSSLPRSIPVELLNYNPMCREKYTALHKEYPVLETRPLEAKQLLSYKDILKNYGLNVI